MYMLLYIIVIEGRNEKLHLQTILQFILNVQINTKRGPHKVKYVGTSTGIVIKILAFDTTTSTITTIEVY